MVFPTRAGALRDPDPKSWCCGLCGRSYKQFLVGINRRLPQWIQVLDYRNEGRLKQAEIQRLENVSSSCSAWLNQKSWFVDRHPPVLGVFTRRTLKGVPHSGLDCSLFEALSVRMTQSFETYTLCLSFVSGRLPNADMGSVGKTIQHVRDVFYRMGFNDREIVSLLGAHAVGRCHTEASGENPSKCSEATCWCSVKAGVTTLRASIAIVCSAKDRSSDRSSCLVVKVPRPVLLLLCAKDRRRLQSHVFFVEIDCAVVPGRDCLTPQPCHC